MRASLLSILFALASGVGAADLFTLDLATSGEEVPALSVPASGKIEFSLVQPKPSETPTPVDLTLSLFSAEGHSVTVNLAVPGVPEARPVHRNIVVSNAVMPLQLSVSNLPTAGKYRGTLILSTGGKEPPKIWKLTLTRAPVYQPGTLVLDQQAADPLDITLPFISLPIFQCCSNPEREITVRLREKNKIWELNGISARLEQVGKAPAAGFNLEKNVQFEFNGQVASNFTSGDAAAQNIPAGQQATVKLKVRNLTSGEYNVTLRFSAINSPEDAAQKLTLTFHVRDSVWRAVLILVLALAVSFCVTKLIGFSRSRFLLCKRINEVKNNRQWFQNAPAILPVVWARAVLRQCEDLSHRLWLSGVEVIEDRVKQAAAVIDILEKIQQVQDGFRKLSPFVAVRAKVAAERIVGKIQLGALNEAATTQLNSETTALGDWLDGTKCQALYWEEVRKAIERLLIDVKLQEIKDSVHRTVLEALVQSLKQTATQPPVTPEDKIAREDEYARLKILWERRDWPEFKDLVKSQIKKPPLREIFDEADKQAWERIKKAVKGPDQPHAEIKAPSSNGAEALEAYDPIVFRFTTNDPNLDQTHLFLHGLKYKWTFQRDRVQSVVETDEPYAVEYMQGAGELQVTVEIIKGTEPPLTVKAPKTVKVEDSKDFDWKEGLEAVELGSLFLAAIIAIATGISTVYFKNTSFGTFQDYLLLFLWGAAVDQMKNTLQVMQSYSTPGAGQ
ncbi:MAG TPA: hypothetical protein VGF13_12685 [Verrucomicrobiae bacterium]|jgi:hypothetical protein